MYFSEIALEMNEGKLNFYSAKYLGNKLSSFKLGLHHYILAIVSLHLKRKDVWRFVKFTLSPGVAITLFRKVT